MKVVDKKLGREMAMGICFIGEGRIEIDARLKGKTRFRTLLHEIYHEINPSFSESQVLKAERIMIDILWEQGYRRVDL